jgi:DNA-binding MarR family transcriptional regulator
VPSSTIEQTVKADQGAGHAARVGAAGTAATTAATTATAPAVAANAGTVEAQVQGPGIAALDVGELSAPRLRTAVARIARWLRPTAAAGALTATEIDMLVVAEKHGPGRMSDLATFCGLNPTMLSRMVPKLEQSGFLRRQPDPADGRVWRVEATKKARSLLQRVRSERNDALSRLLAELDEPEQRAIAEAIPVLEKLSERLRSQMAAESARR